MTVVKADSGQEAQADRDHQADMAAADQAAIRPTVSVVICAYTIDRWEDLKQAVVSVRKQTEAADEIVLVIDHCPELLTQAELLAELLSCRIIVIPNRFGQGLSGARNTGTAVAHGDIVAFLDDDAVADPDWLTRIVNHYEDPQVLGVCGMVRPDWEDERPRGSRPSSTGWWAARIEVCQPVAPRCATSSVPTCPSVGPFSRIARASPARLARLVPSRAVARKPSCVCASASATLIASCCTSRLRPFAIECPISAPTGDTCGPGAMRKAFPRPRWPGWPGRAGLLPPSALTSVPRSPAGSCDLWLMPLVVGSIGGLAALTMVVAVAVMASAIW